ncbi:MAG: glucan biosynthesis protein D [Betaproteobacteria bacterium]|nr:glucan biosynthesis protein D [Betaproteobacteria bacterium]
MTALATGTVMAAFARPSWSAEGAPAGVPALALGPEQPFSFEALCEQARALARRPFEAVPVSHRDVVEQIDWEAHSQIRFKPEAALFAAGPGQFPVAFFHPGKFFPAPVHMYRVEHGQAREVLYDPRLFDMPANSPAHGLGSDAGFAGLRIQESRLAGPGHPDWHNNDWAAFLGASYFRAIGDQYQYGLSARGLAIDVAVPGLKEEFPAFTHFYIEPATDDSNRITVYALLDSPSAAGAYRFVLTRGSNVVMDVEAQVNLRRDVAQLGLAPATSMYLFSKTAKKTRYDWRPEVHDSDGLALWTGSGEHLWRPLEDPPHHRLSLFADRDPRGFGLMQRERHFDAYLDAVHYERRPSLWVEPLDAWGEGSVLLWEIASPEETIDNVVAMWVPKAPARAGAELRLRYRLYWQAEEPFPTPYARCTATLRGRGGQPEHPPRPAGVEKFVVAFEGPALAALPPGAVPEAVLSATHGTFSSVFTEAVPDGKPGHWRAQFDYRPESTDTAELRLFLRHAGQPLSETWLFQYQPDPA